MKNRNILAIFTFIGFTFLLSGCGNQISCDDSEIMEKLEEIHKKDKDELINKLLLLSIYYKRPSTTNPMAVQEEIFEDYKRYGNAGLEKEMNRFVKNLYENKTYNYAVGITNLVKNKDSLIKETIQGPKTVSSAKDGCLCEISWTYRKFNPSTMLVKDNNITPVVSYEDSTITRKLQYETGVKDSKVDRFKITSNTVSNN